MVKKKTIVAKTPTPIKHVYAYCEVNPNKFFILKRAIGSATKWNKYAEANFESAAKNMVNILNAAG